VQKAPTIRDVARAAGVSAAVVSRVLNEGTGSVASSTRAKVVQAIDELAYRPRAAARELSNGSRSSPIGLVLTDVMNPFFAKLADRIVWEARARGVQVVLMTTQEDPHVEGQVLDTLMNHMVGGVIATPTGGNKDKWARLQKAGVNLVFVDRTITELPGTDLVSIHNVLSASTTAEYLIGLGHERIGLVSGPLSTSTGRARVMGYRQALTKAGLAWDPRLVRDIPFRGAAGGDAVSSLLALEDAPTALVVANTAQVHHALLRLTQMGINIPHELSVIIFDDNPWAEIVTPSLSAIQQPIEMLALHSVELLLDRMRGQLPPEAQTIQVQSEFISRNSCAPPPYVRPSADARSDFRTGVSRPPEYTP